MANSRSNIYPVQLQGAELNLNKYDAEIKQYSGFNKNNSPFVGGCLSNVFTKEQQIEGGNDNNTIITEDGTVYRVDTTGLYKNDTKLIDTTGKDFYDVEDMGAAFPNNAVYVYDEDTFITGEDTRFYYNSGKVKIELLQGIENIGSGLDYYITKKSIFGAEYEFVLVKYYYAGYHYSILILKKDEEGELEYSYIAPLIDFQPNFEQVLIPYIHFSEEQNNAIRFAILGAFSRPSDEEFGKVYSFDGSTVTFIKTIKPAFRNGSGTYAAILRQKSVFSAKFDYFVGQNYAASMGESLKCSFSIDFSDDTTKGITLDMDYPTDNTVLIKDNRVVFAKHWGILAATVAYLQAEPTKIKGFTIDDEISTFASGSVTTPSFNIGGLINDCVLTNNEVASGISLPGGWILACEWNTVDLNFIFFGENTQTWKDNKFVCLWKNINNGHWYKLVKSTPKIKLLNNQVIINSNTVFNSYDVLRNKVLLFAPAWNNRHFNIIANSFAVPQNLYFASAINEYALEDNSSIIINPIAILTTTVSLGNWNVLPAKVNVVFIDYFRSSQLNTAVTYRGSLVVTANGSKFSNTNSVASGLPFPSNTDGNVQYSPSLFAKQLDVYGNTVLIKELGGTSYKLMTYDNKSVMSFFLATAIEGLQDFFVIQGQLYGILDDNIFSFQINNEVVSQGYFVVSVKNLQFVGNTPYEALFFSKTNRCLYSFTGANVLNQKQLVDKISEVRNYLYNPATQTIFLVTNIGVFFYSIFGQFLLEYTDVTKIFIQQNGIILSFNNGNYRFIKYYLDEGDTAFEKQRIKLETCFYGMNNEVVTINDCLYIRLFSEEHEEGDLKVSATTISLSGRKTEDTTFKIKASDWDAITHTIYLRYQPKEQRGLGVSFSIDSPFKIASLSVGSQADAILVDKVSKGAINAPQITSNNAEW